MKTEEDYLRKVFGESEIAKDNTIYPNAIQRPKIYQAMKEYAAQESDKAIDLAISIAFYYAGAITASVIEQELLKLEVKRQL